MKLYSKQIHHGTNLRRLREAKGLKQNAMAELLDISQQSISRYESLSTVNDKILLKFSSALNIPVDLIKNLQSDPTTYIIDNNIISTNESTLAENFEFRTFKENFELIILEKEKEKETLFQRLLKTEQECNKELTEVLDILAEIKEEIRSLKKHFINNKY